LKTLLERSYCFHAGLDEFVEEEDEYDLIVSNPHFIKTTKQKMNMIYRFQEAMPLRKIEAAAFTF
jgi:tRNA1Val (adenine37-N6)-methyltransferase